MLLLKTNGFEITTIDEQQLDWRRDGQTDIVGNSNVSFTSTAHSARLTNNKRFYFRSAVRIKSAENSAARDKIVSNANLSLTKDTCFNKRIVWIMLAAH